VGELTTALAFCERSQSIVIWSAANDATHYVMKVSATAPHRSWEREQHPVKGLDSAGTRCSSVADPVSHVEGVRRGDWIAGFVDGDGVRQASVVLL
jgi:hypothetical protein